MFSFHLNFKVKQVIFFRKMILKYFDEDTSSLTVRSNCCDNCSRGLSSWKFCDLYEGIDGDGQFDFSKDADILFNAIRSMEAKDISPERDLVVKLLRGESIRSLQTLPAHGKGRGREPYYWGALIDQLTSAEYIDYKYIWENLLDFGCKRPTMVFKITSEDIETETSWLYLQISHPQTIDTAYGYPIY